MISMLTDRPLPLRVPDRHPGCTPWQLVSVRGDVHLLSAVQMQHSLADTRPNLSIRPPRRHDRPNYRSG